MAKSAEPPLDCLIIGGGPAGLTAAIYLARFRRNVTLIDDGNSRAALIPESHNYPGFADGISGPALLKRLREQAEEYGARLRKGHIESLEKNGDTFVARAKSETVTAHTILLATGVVDESPDIPGLKDAIYQGALRYCPICDGYEATDKRIAVLGTIKSAWKKSLFLRTYSADVTLLPIDDPGAMPEDCATELTEAGVIWPKTRVVDVDRSGKKTIAVALADGERMEFDVLYPALGCQVRSDLATALGAKADEIGCLTVNDKQETSVKGLYAAGDVVTDLDQLSVATGHAALAATAIQNALPRNLR